VHTASPQIVMRIIGALLAALLLVPILTGLERWALKDTSHFGLLACLLGLAFYDVERRRRVQTPQESTLIFEERPAEAFELLKLA
jgi:hypothetical protein